jgi:anti-sigma B factor antagonist
MGLEISIRQSGDVTILDLRGRSTIDAGESELLGRYLRKLLTNDARKLLLNLADLTRIDSSGVSVIIETCVSIRGKGGDLKLLRPRERVLEVLHVLRLPEAIETFDDEPKALASFRPLERLAAGT